MAAAHQLDARLEDVRRAVTSLRESRMAVEVKKAEVRMQLGTVESTLLGTYQVDLATLLDAPVVGDDIRPAASRGRADPGRAAGSQ